MSTDALTCVYRISDAGGDRGKEKIPHATREHCYENFVAEFGPDVVIVADRCSPDLLSFLRARGPRELLTTDHGTVAGGFRTALSWIGEHLADDEPLYLVEDDYLHLEGAKGVLLEGLGIADYVTLYDHPDKYATDGPNPHVQRGAESTRVYLTASTHWKATNSTTLTFAATARVLSQDRNVWWRFSKGPGVDDFRAFMKLRRRLVRPRRLVSPMPGYSTHAEVAWLTPLRDWSDV